MDSATRTIVLVLAAAMIAAAVALILRPARARAGGGGERPEGRRTAGRAALEAVWAIAPVAFLALLIALTAAR